MGKVVDTLIAYRILRMLVTPFEETNAYKLGIIDQHGKELKRMSHLHSEDEMAAYNVLHRMIFRLKRIINKVPVESKKLVSYAAALALIKEHHADVKEPVDLESQFLVKQTFELTEELDAVNEFMSNNYTKTFRQFLEDVAVNNAAATPGIAGMTEPVVPSTNKLTSRVKLFRRKKDVKYVNQ